MFLLNGKPIPLDTAFTVGEGDQAIQLPANWLRLSSPLDRDALGIMEVPDPVRADDRLYWNGDISNPKALEDVTTTGEDGKTYTTKGLKSVFTDQVRHTCYTLLLQTDWAVIRKSERGIEIPQDIADLRTHYLQTLTHLELAISLVTTVEELAALNLSFELVQNP